MEQEVAKQFCEHIDYAINLINESNSIDATIDQLCEDICFWDGNTEISRKYLMPLKGKSKEDVKVGLEYVKSMYLKKGNPFFYPWG